MQKAPNDTTDNRGLTGDRVSTRLLQANAGPEPGDRPLNRLVRSYPLPMYATVSKVDAVTEPAEILVTALERIALNIHGDTVPQVVAGDALDQFRSLTAVTRACPDASSMTDFACSNAHQCWEPCGLLGKDPNHAVPAAAGSAEETPATIEDLAALVRQLTRMLSKADPGNSLVPRALSYLQRKGLAGDPLR